MRGGSGALAGAGSSGNALRGEGRRRAEGQGVAERRMARVVVARSGTRLP